MENQFAQQMPLAKRLFIARYQGEKEIIKLQQFPKLQELATNVVADNYSLYPELEGVPLRIRNNIIAKAAKDLEIHVAAPNIDNESYWKEACKGKKDTWKLTRIEQHGNSWKNAYCEKNLVEFLMSFPKDKPPKTPELKRIYQASKFNVFNLHCPELKYGLNYEDMFQQLPFLMNLTLTLGVKHAGKAYRRDDLGMNMDQAMSLATGIAKSEYLLKLSLPGNVIQDDLIKILVDEGLQKNKSLIELDLAHNAISTKGCVVISELIMKNYTLKKLNLFDNRIDNAGCKFIALALMWNKFTAIEDLNLKLNRIKDKGGTRFFQTATSVKSLKRLNFAANALGKTTAMQMCDYLADPKCSLEFLDLSSNLMDKSAFRYLSTGLTKNVSLKKFDCSRTKMSPANEAKLRNLITQKFLEKQQIPFIKEWNYKEIIEKQIAKEKSLLNAKNKGEGDDD